MVAKSLHHRVGTSHRKWCQLYKCSEMPHNMADWHRVNNVTNRSCSKSSNVILAIGYANTPCLRWQRIFRVLFNIKWCYNTIVPVNLHLSINVTGVSRCSSLCLEIMLSCSADCDCTIHWLRAFIVDRFYIVHSKLYVPWTDAGRIKLQLTEQWKFLVRDSL